MKEKLQGKTRRPNLKFWVAVNGTFKIKATTEEMAHAEALRRMQSCLNRGCISPITFNTESA